MDNNYINFYNNLIHLTRNKNIYNLSPTQVNSILELKLQKLTALGINEIESEIKKLSELIFKYKKMFKRRRGRSCSS